MSISHCKNFNIAGIEALGGLENMGEDEKVHFWCQSEGKSFFEVSCACPFVPPFDLGRDEQIIKSQTWCKSQKRRTLPPCGRARAGVETVMFDVFIDHSDV